jgi:predicted peptidase
VLREGTCGIPGKTGYRYLVHQPGTSPGHGGALPLVLFLHGSDERGDAPARVSRHGLPRLVADGRDLPFVLLAPQCPAGRRWSVRALSALLQHALATFPVAPDRVVVTGLSLGAEAAWALAMYHPTWFAGMATVCGGGAPSRAGRLRHLPCRVYHGALDTQVPLADSQAMVTALAAAGGDVRLVIYPDAGHAEAWRRAYADPDLLAFLASAHRRTPPPRSRPTSST